jgi:hypothetical protein
MADLIRDKSCGKSLRCNRAAGASGRDCLRFLTQFNDPRRRIENHALTPMGRGGGSAVPDLPVPDCRPIQPE